MRMCLCFVASGEGALEKAKVEKDPKAVTAEEWREILDPETYQVTRESGTEPPFSGKYDKHMKDGVYNCVCCGAPLFRYEECVYICSTYCFAPRVPSCPLFAS